MGRSQPQKIPEELEHFFKSLKSSNCSAKWDWNKLIEIHQPGNRNVNLFNNLCEAGIFHIMHSKPSKRESNLICKKLHTSDTDLLNSVGTCYSLQLLSAAASNRSEKFKETFMQIVSTLLDALITALKVSDFNPSILQPLTTLQAAKKEILPRLSPVSESGVSNVLELAVCRIYVLSSTLRGIFECGTPFPVPLCVPYLCSLITAAFSVNICDPRRTSFTLISCAKQLLHTFSVIVQSCGVNIAPGAPSLITSMVYQLEWSSSFSRSHPSKESLTYKLAVYRCLSSLLDATAQVAFLSLSRLANRIIAEISSDMAFLTRENLTLSSNGGNLLIHELHVCCAVASIRLLELLFVNHHFILTRSLSEGINGSNDSGDRDTCDYKLKHALLSLSTQINNLASKLVSLLHKQPRLSPTEEVLVRPHFLLPFINTASAVVDYGFLFSRSNALHDLSKSLLAHRDYTLRLTADRCFRHCFKSLKSELPFEQTNNERSVASSFTQTDVIELPVQSEKELESTPEVNAFVIVQNNSISMPAEPTLPENSNTSTSKLESGDSENLIGVHKKAVIIPPPTEPMETPKRSKNRVQKRVRFEDTSSPPGSSKKPCPEPKGINRAPTPAKPPKESQSLKEEKTDVNLPAIDDVLCTFDDTLL